MIIGKAVLSQISRCVLVDSYERARVGVGVGARSFHRGGGISAGGGVDGSTRHMGK